MEIKFAAGHETVIKRIAEAAAESATEAYLVGGFVRDYLLERPTSDADVVCLGDGIQLAKKVAARFNPAPRVSFFKNYGTAQIKVELPPENPLLDLPIPFEIEFVGARKESYQQESRNPHVLPGTFLDDQERRDFTINTLAVSLNASDYGRLIDTFNGMDDLQNRIIRTPQDPEKTFSDDPLRMMRAIRFATQLRFTIEPVTLDAIKANAGRIRIITAERITHELNKILAADKPSIGFDLLYKTGLLHIIFPQMVDLAGAEYIDGHGHKDNFYHTLQVIDNVAAVSDDLWLRWAAVLHDIAKPATKRFEEGHGWTFHGHEVVGGRMVPKIFAQLKLPLNEKMRFVRKLVELHLRPISVTKENITDSAIRRLLFDAGEDFDSLMQLCEADITSKNRFKVKRYLENFQVVRERCKEVEEKDHLRSWQPPVDGQQIMDMFGLAPSRPVGILKDSLKDAILDGDIPNTVDAAREFLLNKAADMGIKAKNP